MTRPTARIREELRQRRHHRAFRIPPPRLDDEAQARLAALLDALSGADRGTAVEEGALADAATILWSAHRRLSRPQPGSGRPSQEARRALRFLRNCDEALAEAGVVTQDHDGDRFDPGRSLRVLDFVDDPALTTETVRETTQPSIYLHGRRIRMGVVIVGRPIPPTTGHVEDSHA